LTICKATPISKYAYPKITRYLLGDAVHRHPPLNGLGSNTCVQDAYNLAWKVAYVLKGQAGAGILDSYTKERQPVGHSVIRRANQGLRDHVPVWQALGIMEPDKDSIKRAFEELCQASPEGAARRKALQVAVERTSHEFHGLGIEMNQRYQSTAIYSADETSVATLPEDPILEHRITTHAGARLPHAWLNTRIPSEQLSTHDLAGHGCFSLFTGIGGEKWKDASKKVSSALGIEIKSYSIGWMQDYEDVYSDWARRREIEEDGCVLVRPDRFVAWRAINAVAESEESLLRVMKSILSR
jgi:hypothetical protein